MKDGSDDIRVFVPRHAGRENEEAALGVSRSQINNGGKKNA
jgi:hypothetical protein